jgi:hypothetical protein
LEAAAMTLREAPYILAIALATTPFEASALAQTAAPATQAPAAATAADDEKVDPETVKALQTMGAYLMTLKSFEVQTQTTMDLVRNDDQTVQLDGSASYKVRRPDAFVIRVDSDRKSRVFVYDGKQFTLYAPHLDLYSTVPAPGTIRETLGYIGDKFGVILPLEDLFQWGDAATRAKKLDSAFFAGTATIDGAATNQYVIREGKLDWQIWIQQGAQPLPRKLVIADRSDPARPTYIARMAWTLNPTFAANEFTFLPGKEAKAIQLTRVAP